MRASCLPSWGYVTEICNYGQGRTFYLCTSFFHSFTILLNYPGTKRFICWQVDLTSSLTYTLELLLENYYNNYYGCCSWQVLIWMMPAPTTEASCITQNITPVEKLHSFLFDHTYSNCGNFIAACDNFGRINVFKWALQFKLHPFFFNIQCSLL